MSLESLIIVPVLYCELYSNVFHRCRSRQILGVDISRISQNLPEKVLCRKLSPYKFSVAVGYSFINSETWRLSFFFEFKFFLQIMFPGNSDTFHSVSSHTHGSLNSKQRCLHFCAHIFDELKLLVMRLHPQVLHPGMWKRLFRQPLPHLSLPLPTESGL